MLSIGRRPSTDMKQSGMEVDRMAYAGVLCLQNKVLGNISKRHERNDADSRYIICVIVNGNSVRNFKFKIKEV